jgi:hypothetical protein
MSTTSWARDYAVSAMGFQEVHIRAYIRKPEQAMITATKYASGAECFVAMATGMLCE